MYYKKYDGKFPKDSDESVGRFVGISENVGHSMTYKILTADGKVISRAVARTARKCWKIGHVELASRANVGPMSWIGASEGPVISRGVTNKL